MQKLFIVVTSIDFIRSNNKMRKADSLENAMKIIANLEDSVSVENFFSVDEIGHVVHYEIIFDRRLIAKPKEEMN